MVKIGIIGAMEQEIKELLLHIKDKKEDQWTDFVFHTGKLFGKEIVIVKSGIGKVFSALVCQRMIDKYSPTHIIFTGVAGSLNNKLNIGDVVISNDCIQHDIEAKGLGFDRGHIPYTEYREFIAEKKLKEIALMTNLKSHKVVEGRILTGDQFLTDKNKYPYLTNELKGDAIEMEGGSVAQVCTINRIPFVIVRSISDKADGSASVDFTEFLKEAAKNSFEVVKNILNHYNTEEL